MFAKSKWKLWCVFDPVLNKGWVTLASFVCSWPSIECQWIAGAIRAGWVNNKLEGKWRVKVEICFIVSLEWLLAEKLASPGALLPPDGRIQGAGLIGKARSSRKRDAASWLQASAASAAMCSFAKRSRRAHRRKRERARVFLTFARSAATAAE